MMSLPTCSHCSQKQEYSGDILTAMETLKQDGGLEKWGSATLPGRVNVFQGELKKVGVKNTGTDHHINKTLPCGSSS